MDSGKAKTVSVIFLLAAIMLLGNLTVGKEESEFKSDKDKRQLSFNNKKRAHVIFLSAESEYDAVKTLPEFGRELKEKYGFSCQVLQGSTKPKDAKRNNIPGMEALKDADLVVLFVRRRALPPKQMKYFRDYMNN